MKIDLRDLTIPKTSSSVKSPVQIPQDYVEIFPSYIKIFKGQWLKYTVIQTQESFPGGFLIDIDENDTVILRNIKQVITQLPVQDCVWYCKKDLEIYKAVQELILNIQKFENEKRQFNAERNKFIQEKKEFFLKNNSKN